jgi:hypothetical protein
MRLGDFQWNGRLVQAGVLLTTGMLLLCSLLAGFRTEIRKLDGQAQRQLDLAVDHAKGTFRAIDWMASSISDSVQGLSREDIKAKEESLHQRLGRAVAAIRAINFIEILDRSGNVLVSSAMFPASARPGEDARPAQPSVR